MIWYRNFHAFALKPCPQETRRQSDYWREQVSTVLLRKNLTGGNCWTEVIETVKLDNGQMLVNECAIQ